MKKKKNLFVIGAAFLALILIVGGIFLVVNRDNGNGNDDNGGSEVVDADENQTLDNVIDWDGEDAATGFWVDTESDIVSIGSVNLDSIVSERKVYITFDVTADAAITSARQGVFTFKNDEGEVFETLRFEIPAMAAGESTPIELVSDNLETIRTTMLEFSME